MPRRAVNAVEQPLTTEELTEVVAGFYADPLGFTLFAFPWGEDGTTLGSETGPDEWQTRCLTLLGEAVLARAQDRERRMGAFWMAVASGHGVGKSALVCFIILWFMSCREDPAIVVTANTANQLASKTWRELAKWHRLCLTGSWFQWTATRLYNKDRPETWCASAIPWSKERSEGFAGLHAKHVLVIFDEASAIDDVIWEVTEGAMTTAGALWLAFGNPTRNTGRFRECFRRYRHRWVTLQVDSRTAKQANRAQIDKWIEDYGEDSDFARVRVRGEFPRSSSTQLIGTDLVIEAQRRFRAYFGERVRVALAEGPSGLETVRLTDNDLAPRLMTVDVARFGSDQSVIGWRQGSAFVVLAKYRELDTTQLAYRVAEWITGAGPDQVFIDVVGMGAGVVDTLTNLGYEVVSVNGGQKALQEKRFFNRRAEMWWAMRDWLKAGGMVPHDDREISDDLTGPLYGFSDRGERVQLEGKDDMRARGLPSPDVADALSMSFWMPVAPRQAAVETVADRLQRLANKRRGGGARSWMSY